MVLPTLQGLKLQGITMSNGARITLVYFYNVSQVLCGAVTEQLHMTVDLKIIGLILSGDLFRSFFIILSAKLL